MNYLKIIRMKTQMPKKTALSNEGGFAIWRLENLKLIQLIQTSLLKIKFNKQNILYLF